jgi:hypothetical protein
MGKVRRRITLGVDYISGASRAWIFQTLGGTAYLAVLIHCSYEYHARSTTISPRPLTIAPGSLIQMPIDLTGCWQDDDRAGE